MHYALVIIIIIVIICFQASSLVSTLKKIRSYRDIFPADASSYYISETNINNDDSDNGDNENDDEYSTDDVVNDEIVTVSQINVDSDSLTMKKIVFAINRYLQKNRGAASDFHLMKDVVERYCDAESDEITTQQPIPLYLGLMGTMVGIIFGIGSIAIFGDIAAGGAILDHVKELMVCVAIAMFASLAGVFCTTLIAWLSKNANSEVEADKNHFYSWLQTELLPVLSGNTANAIHLLQQNLLTFNLTFKRNIDGLSSALSQISDSSHEQVQLIQLIRDIDIRRVAQANIEVLRELKSCTGEISHFNTYLHSVAGYLDAVNALNSNINDHLNRTAAIERMGSFFERELEQVQTREQYINQVVANVDNTLRDTFNALKESTESGVLELRRTSATEFETLRDTLTEEKQAFRESLLSRNTEFSDYVREQKEILSQKAEEIIALTNEIKSMSETKAAIDRMVNATNEQNSKLDKMIELLRNQKPTIIASQGKGTDTPQGTNYYPNIVIPNWIKVSIIVGLLLLFSMLCLRLFDIFGWTFGNSKNISDDVTITTNPTVENVQPIPETHLEDEKVTYEPSAAEDMGSELEVAPQTNQEDF